MGFWWFMFFCDLQVPAVMIFGGRMMWKHPPGKINGIIGYRTSRSMKNKETWKFAQEYCGRLWWKIGWLMLAPSAILHISFYGCPEETVGMVGGFLCIVQCAVLIGSIFPTERALKKNFTDEGKQR